MENTKSDHKNTRCKNETCINCPYCGITIVIETLNCGIFRCGTMKKTMVQIPPHASKKTCDDLYKTEQIYGCGKPFLVKVVNTVFKVSKCDYI